MAAPGSGPSIWYMWESSVFPTEVVAGLHARLQMGCLPAASSAGAGSVSHRATTVPVASWVSVATPNLTCARYTLGSGNDTLTG